MTLDAHDAPESVFGWHSESVPPELRISVHGELDLTVATRFRDEMQALAGGHTAVLMSLADVTFVDSSGLSALLALQRTIGTSTGFKLTELSEAVIRLFELTRIGQIIRFQDPRHCPVCDHETYAMHARCLACSAEIGLPGSEPPDEELALAPGL